MSKRGKISEEKEDEPRGLSKKNKNCKTRSRPYPEKPIRIITRLGGGSNGKPRSSLSSKKRAKGHKPRYSCREENKSIQDKGARSDSNCPA